MLKTFSLFILILITYVSCRQAWYINRLSKKVDFTAQPFQRNIPNASLKVLFLGDSTAVGSGSQTPETSTSGWFSKDFPNASIENISENGIKISALIPKLDQLKSDHYDIVIMHIGGNDIIRLTSSKKIESDIRTVINFLKPRAKQIIFLHSGDIGKSKFFIWPFNLIISARSYNMRKIYKKVAEDTGTNYVDLIAMETSKTFAAKPEEYYAPDQLHLTGKGYRLWYDMIRAQIR
ncbi:MAG: hypothetical protein H6754_04980 [Candidatus Omnitrophica bacterium]|nr:hypothetical protein [Candidatus Omnitrophota bacterium]